MVTDNLMDEFSEVLQFGERLTRTLPRSFKSPNKQFFRVKYGASAVPTLDRKMLGTPTSPVKPPEMDNLRPPKEKLELPLRMKCFLGAIREDAPEPQMPSTLSKPTSIHPRYNSRTGTFINGKSALPYLQQGCYSKKRIHSGHVAQ